MHPARHPLDPPIGIRFKFLVQVNLQSLIPHDKCDFFRFLKIAIDLHTCKDTYEV